MMMETADSQQQIDKLTYGKDLWCSLGLIEKSTREREIAMQGLRNFFHSFRKNLDNFTFAMAKSLSQFDSEVLSEDPIDTLNSAFVYVRNHVEGLAKQVEMNSEMIMNDLVEPLDLYAKHYSSTN